jgi:cobalamin biosynthesis Mg chelatase CobN
MENDASNRGGTPTDRGAGPDKIGVYDRTSGTTTSGTTTSGTTTSGTTGTGTTSARTAATGTATTGSAATGTSSTRWIIRAIVAVLIILALVYIL